jgi:hypothetical protein
MFQILNYIAQLQNVETHNSWLLADCPICGAHKLKVVTVGKKAGAFACYENSCEKNKPNPIVKELTKNEFKPRRSSHLRQIKLPPLRDIIKPLPLSLQEIDDTQFFSALSYEKPWHTYFDDGKKLTIYKYDDFNLHRIDAAPDSNEKKFFYFRIKKENGEWSNEVPTVFRNVPLYRSEYISSHVIFVEGEKCAAALQELGLNCLSFPSFVYQQSYLAKFLRCLSYRIKNAIYLVDNDEIGEAKAQKFLQEAWKSGINASSYNIAQLLGRGAEKNYDVADAIENWEICTREELLGILKNAV